MYDLSSEILDFHNQYVKLDTDSEKRLVEVRDTNLSRIRNGLGDLGKPVFKNWRNQGGYAMGTVVNDPLGESNHDIDVAIIFDKDDLPAGALQTRQRVRDALCKRGTNFLKDPEARTNAVTVWYADGYHLDFAIYRRSTNIFGAETHEHAGADWVVRDPAEVTTWFIDKVDALSPNASTHDPAPSVRVNQLRRVVRMVKWYCRSRTSWSLPGGMITSTLVTECYCPDPYRDDVALYDTLAALNIRLQNGCQVYHPANDGRELTGKAEYLNQVKALRDRLAKHLPKLDVLFEEQCNRQRARSAWDWIFNHQFWSGKEVVEEASLTKTDTRIAGYYVTLGCDLAKSQRGKIVGPYRGIALPKNMGLRFFVDATNVSEPYELRFDASNEGDEAKDAGQLEWSGRTTSDEPEWWTSTAYKGKHRMTCSILKSGQVVAISSMVVKIVRSPLRFRR